MIAIDYRVVSRILFLPLIVMTISTLVPAQSAEAPKPPVAKKQPHQTEIHGLKLQDDYFWFRDKSNPEVRAYLEAENAYTDSVMKPTGPLQKKLYDEMLSRIKETDVNVPYKDGNYFYYSRTETGKQYPFLCRKKGSLDAPEEVVLDVNKLAEGQTFMSVATFRVSDDGNLLEYSTDNTGFRQYTLHVKNLQTGELLPDRVEKTGTVAWAADNKTLFYTVEDSAKRQYRMYRHTVGTTGPDDLIYEEKDERFEVYVDRVRSGKYIILQSNSHTTSEARFISADQPMAEWKVVEPRRAGIEYYLDHHGEEFYVRTNDTGRNFRLVKAPVADPSSKNWKEVVPHRADVMLQDMDFFKDFYVLVERDKGLVELTVKDFKTGEKSRVEFPEKSYVAGPEQNREFDTKQYRYRYQSFITPNSVYDYDVEKHASTLLKRTEVLGGYDPAKYEVERVFATAADGVKVPISILLKKGLVKDGKAPIYLYAYGSYGVPMDAGFNSNRFSLVDRGVVYAIAHIRGGGDLGKPWHDAGKMMNKKNTFTDFISCAEYLVNEKYGSKDRLVIEGGSAGGLLMGAVTNMRPDLFHAVIAKVPFVDVINTMLDESLPLTVGEFEEWGNPKEKAAFDYMYSYSPYDNVTAKTYPDMLVKTSFNDSQVMYWEPTKYVAKMRAVRTDHNRLILKTNMGAGHGGSSGRYDFLHDVAFDYAFILKEVGIAE
jgi:oligopeptidase B